jgi:hypothetical protein
VKLIRGPLSQYGIERLEDFVAKNLQPGVDENYKPKTDFSRLVVDIQSQDYTLSLDAYNNIILTGTFLVLNEYQKTNTGLNVEYTLTEDDFEFSLENS